MRFQGEKATSSSSCLVRGTNFPYFTFSSIENYSFLRRANRRCYSCCLSFVIHSFVHPTVIKMGDKNEQPKQRCRTEKYFIFHIVPLVNKCVLISAPLCALASRIQVCVLLLLAEAQNRSRIEILLTSTALVLHQRQLCDELWFFFLRERCCLFYVKNAQLLNAYFRWYEGVTLICEANNEVSKKKR